MMVLSSFTNTLVFVSRGNAYLVYSSAASDGARRLHAIVDALLAAAQHVDVDDVAATTERRPRPHARLAESLDAREHVRTRHALHVRAEVRSIVFSRLRECVRDSRVVTTRPEVERSIPRKRDASVLV